MRCDKNIIIDFSANFEIKPNLNLDQKKKTNKQTKENSLFLTNFYCHNFPIYLEVRI